MKGLPPGFRFEPTEEELVFEYLKCKVLSSALPASIIPDINGVWNLDPWDIPCAAGSGGGEESEKYLFSKKEDHKNINGNSKGIVGWSRSGYWKARSGKEREIVSSDNGIAFVGMKNTLYFYTNNTRKTCWVMNQYRLILPPHYHIHFDFHNNNKWLLCHIFFNNNHHQPPLPYSISSTNHQDQHHLLTVTPTAFSDDDDSVSSTASSSSTSAAFTDFTSPPTTTTTTMGF